MAKKSWLGVHWFVRLDVRWGSCKAGVKKEHVVQDALTESHPCGRPAFQGRSYRKLKTLKVDMPKGNDFMPDVLKKWRSWTKRQGRHSQKSKFQKQHFVENLLLTVEGKCCISSRKTSFKSSPWVERIELADLLMHWALEYGILTWIFLMRWAPISQVYVLVTLNPSTP